MDPNPEAQDRFANRYYFVAFQDQSGVLLLQRSRDGHHISSATLDQTDDPQKPSREATFTDVRVTEFMSFDGGFEFTFEAASVQFPLGIAPDVQHKRRGDGSLDGPIRPRWPGIQHD